MMSGEKARSQATAIIQLNSTKEPKRTKDAAINVCLCTREISGHYILGKQNDRTFLRIIGGYLHWGPAVGEVIMDIGCGAGQSSTQLLQVFPLIRKIIAVDKLPKRINDANTNNPHDKIEYRVANILDWSSLVEWEGILSKIASCQYFNYLNDPPLAFRNVYRLLKPGGSAAIKFLLHSPYYDVIKELNEHPKWKTFVENVENIVPESHKMKYTSSYYRNILDEIGFEIVYFQEMEECLTYESDQVCRNLTYHSIPLVKSVRKNQVNGFMDCTFNILMKRNSNPERLSGLPYMKQNTLSIAIRKPPGNNPSDLLEHITPSCAFQYFN